MSVKARVSHVKVVPAGARLSYGLRYETDGPTRIATVPIGYADGVPRELPHRGGDGARARSPVPDGRHRHDGPADARRR